MRLLCFARQPAIIIRHLRIARTSQCQQCHGILLAISGRRSFEHDEISPNEIRLYSMRKRRKVRIHVAMWPMREESTRVHSSISGRIARSLSAAPEARIVAHDGKRDYGS